MGTVGNWSANSREDQNWLSAKEETKVLSTGSADEATFQIRRYFRFFLTLTSVAACACNVAATQQSRFPQDAIVNLVVQ